MHYEALKQVWGAADRDGRAVRGGQRRGGRHAGAGVQERAAQRARALALHRPVRRARLHRLPGRAHHLRRGARRRSPRSPPGCWPQGVEPGDRVAIAMRNYPEWMLIYWACVSIGVAVVGMNAWWVADEVEYALNDSEPKVVFCDPSGWRASWSGRRRAAPRQAGGDARRGLPAGVIPWSDVIAQAAPMPDVDVDPDADACIFYTSGTTGRPKGAQLTHRGCINNLMNIDVRRPGAGAARPRRPPAWRRPTDAADAGRAADHAALPRHRQQLRRLRDHRRRRHDGADVPLGRRRGAEADRARAGHRDERACR